MKTNKNTQASLTITIEFGCNNNCVSCMLRDVKDKLKPVTFEEYKKILNENLASKKYTSLILSGAEVTTNKNLLQFIKYAKKLGSFEHIRIQTNGRKLSDYNYCKDLISAGVDEFFISVLAHNSITHDSITQKKGSFKETINGINNVNKFNVSIIINTVITKLNYSCLSNIIKTFSKINKINEFQFWVYCPLNFTDKYDLIESSLKIKPHILKAITEAKSLKKLVKIKYFPECLLGAYRKCLDNSQSYTIMDRSFWKKFKMNKFQCIYQGICQSKKCCGFPLAYIRKFGWEEDFLKPL